MKNETLVDTSKIHGGKEFGDAIRKMSGKELMVAFMDELGVLRKTRLFNRPKLGHQFSRLNKIKKLLLKRGIRADISYSSLFSHRNTGEIYGNVSRVPSMVSGGEVNAVSQGGLSVRGTLPEIVGTTEVIPTSPTYTLRVNDDTKGVKEMKIKIQKCEKRSRKITGHKKMSPIYEAIESLKVGEELVIEAGTKKSRNLQSATSVRLGRLGILQRFKVSSLGGVFSVSRRK